MNKTHTKVLTHQGHRNRQYKGHVNMDLEGITPSQPVLTSSDGVSPDDYDNNSSDAQSELEDFQYNMKRSKSIFCIPRPFISLKRSNSADIKYRKVKKPSFLVPLGKRCRRLSKNDVCYISDLKIKGKAGGIRIKILKNS